MGRSVTGSSSGNTFLTTVSPIGFNAGDPVYVTPNGVGRIPDSYSGSLTFSPTAPQAYQAPRSAPNAGPLRYVETYGGMNYTRAVAVLTNGNVVMAYGKRATAGSSNIYIYFKILDASNNVVVAETLVSGAANYAPGISPIGCLALPNGNFVVLWHGLPGGTRRLSYAIYGPTGTVVTAVTTDSTVVLGSTSRQLAFDARSDSSFVVVSFNDTDQAFYRVISSTGSIVYSGTYGGNVVAATCLNTIAVAVRGDDSYALFYCDPVTPSGVTYQVFNSTNVSQGTGSYLAGGNPQLVNAVCAFSQPGNVTGFVIRNPTYFGFAKLTGTTVSGYQEYYLTIGGEQQGFFADKIASDGSFAITQSAQGNDFSKLIYYVYNSNGIVISNANGIRTRFINSYAQGAIAQPIRIGSEIRFYKSPLNGGAASLYPKGIYYFSLDATTYALNLQSSVTGPIASIAGGSSGYARSASSVTRASFLASTSSTATVTLGPTTTTSSFLLAPTSIGVTAAAYSITSLQNGDLAVVYQVGTTTNPTIFMAIYNSLGVRKQIITVDTGTSQTQPTVRVAQLQNGNIVVIYRNLSVNEIIFKVYSSSYALLYTSGNAANGESIGGNYITISSLDSNNFVFAWVNTSSQIRARVFSDTGSQLATFGGTGFSGNTWVAGSRSGDFIYAGYNGPFSQWRFQLVGKDNANNSWATISNELVVDFIDRIYDQVSSPTGPDDISLFAGGISGSSTMRYYGVVASNLGPPSNISQTYNATSGSTPSLSVSGNGDFVAIATDTGTIRYARVAPTGAGFTPTFNTSYQTTGATCTTNTSIVSSPYYGDSIAILYPSTTNDLTLAIMYVNSSSFTATITQGVTASNPVALSYAGGYAFLGVAVTDCAAGGAGVVQTSGSTALSSSYASVDTQYFDFRNNTTYGTSGVVSGRTVAMGV